MPEPVARAVLVKRLGEEWANDPYLVLAPSLGRCEQRIRIKIKELVFSSIFSGRKYRIRKPP
jgi:hypothetical protein